MIHIVDSDPDTSIKRFWKSYNIKNAVDNTVESWNEVKESNMNEVWHKLWPECINDFTGFITKREPLVKEIVGLANHVGFQDI